MFVGAVFSLISKLLIVPERSVDKKEKQFSNYNEISIINTSDRKTWVKQGIYKKFLLFFNCNMMASEFCRILEF
jgi:hypothetical protein